MYWNAAGYTHYGHDPEYLGFISLSVETANFCRFCEVVKLDLIKIHQLKRYGAPTVESYLSELHRFYL